MEFQLLDEIKDIETIATGRGVYIRRYLERTHGKGRWRKMKGRGEENVPGVFSRPGGLFLALALDRKKVYF